MPLPERNKGEKRDIFINRCMDDEVMKQEYPNNQQRLAVCNSQANKRVGANARYVAPGWLIDDD